MLTSIHLLDARAFPSIAERNGIRETARALTLAGKLLPVNVGRSTYYRWRDVLALMPEWARRLHAAITVEPTVTIDYRPGLSGHTVTVEQATRLIALRTGVAPGDLVAVERTDGRLGVTAPIPDSDIPTAFAAAYASARGARHIQTGGAW